MEKVVKLPKLKIQFLDTFFVLELNNGIDLVICGLRMPKFTMIQSVMLLFFKFGLLTKYCTHCFAERCSLLWFFLVYDGQRIHKQNKSNVQICLFEKILLQPRTFVMRLHMGAINSFCLDDGVASLKFYSCEAVLMRDI